MTLLNKDQIETLNNAVDVLIEGIEWDMLDDEHQAKNAISGADNPYYNAGAFFMFGARANGAIMGYLSKKDRLDKAEEALAEEERINGPESIKADRLAQNVRKNDAAMKTAAFFKALEEELYEAVLGEPFGGGTADDEAKLKWYADKKESILNPRPTASEATSSEDRKKAALARRKASRKAA